MNTTLLPAPFEQMAMKGLPVSLAEQAKRLEETGPNETARAKLSVLLALAEQRMAAFIKDGGIYGSKESADAEMGSVRRLANMWEVEPNAKYLCAITTLIYARQTVLRTYTPPEPEPDTQESLDRQLARLLQQRERINEEIAKVRGKLKKFTK